MASDKKSNILFTMSDDIGWFNVSAYNRGIMGYRTPNIDRITTEGAIFTGLAAKLHRWARSIHYGTVDDRHGTNEGRPARRRASTQLRGPRVGWGLLTEPVS